MSAPKYEPSVIYTNLVRRYGVDRAEALVARFLTGESSTALAKDYGVTASRINQWRDHLIIIAREYKVYPDVQSIANEGLKLVSSPA